MIRAFRDTQLTIPIGRDGSWRQALDIAFGERYRRDVQLYFYNPTSQTLRFYLERHTFENFEVEAPVEIDFPPGVTETTLSFAPKEGLPLPTTEDGLIVLKIDFDYSGSIYDYEDHGANTWNAFAGIPRYSRNDEVILEVTMHQLPWADERKNPRARSYVSDPETYAGYIASAMGYTRAWEDYDEDKGVTVWKGTFDEKVRPLASLCYETVLWALNKHYYTSSEHCPMFLITKRSSAFGYNPPGLDYYPPKIKRSLLSKAFTVARHLGCKEGFNIILAELGMAPITDYVITRTFDTWMFAFKQNRLDEFGDRFLKNMLQYHSSAYEGVRIEVLP